MFGTLYASSLSAPSFSFSFFLSPLSLRILLFAWLDYVLGEKETTLSPQWHSFPLQDKVKDIANTYTDALYRYIRYTFGLDESACHDVLQDLFLKLPDKLNKYDQSKAFEPWLYRVTHNLTLDILRKKKNISDKETMFFPEDDVLASFSYDNLPQHVEQLYKDSLLKVLLRRLNQRERELIILVYLEGKTYEDVAHILEIKPSSLGTLLRRAKIALKAEILKDDKLKEAITFDLRLD